MTTSGHHTASATCPVGPAELTDPGETDADGRALPPTTRQIPARAWRGMQLADTQECVADEVPVALVYNGISHAVMLASPQHLDDFALGFSLTEGIVDGVADLLDVEITPHTLESGAAGLTVDLRVTQRCFMRLKDKRRNLTGRTGCGLCGTENLSEAVRPVPARVPQARITPAALQRGMAELASGQALQQATGASHAAAFCSLDGELLCVREDVGRHNALDKLIGWLARSGHRADQGFICVTSRASYEMVFKTASAGVGLLAAISAPTALAVRTADSAGLTLLGYVRGDRATVYGEGRGFSKP